jgi:hypothetical protein
VAGLEQAEEFYALVLQHPASRDSHRYAAQALAALRFVKRRAEGVARRRAEDGDEAAA